MNRAVQGHLVAVVFLVACGSSQPPPPQPSAAPAVRMIGEPTIVDGETTYVVRGVGYELRSRQRAALAPVQGEIGDAARSFTRYFAEDPPTIVIELEVIEPDSNGGPPQSNRPRLVNHKLIIPVAASTRMGRGPMPVTLTGAAVAWVWLAEYVGARRHEEPLDTASIGPGRIGLPAWLEVAAAAVVAGSRRRLDLYLMALAGQPDELLPLETLFAATGDSLFTPIPALPSAPPPQFRQRGGPPGQAAIHLEGIELFVAQSMAVAHYVTAREGFGSLGRLTNALIDGKTMEEFLAESRWLPKDVPALEESWRHWLADMGGRG